MHLTVNVSEQSPVSRRGQRPPSDLQHGNSGPNRTPPINMILPILPVSGGFGFVNFQCLLMYVFLHTCVCWYVSWCAQGDRAIFGSLFFPPTMWNSGHVRLGIECFYPVSHLTKPVCLFLISQAENVNNNNLHSIKMLGDINTHIQNNGLHMASTQSFF